ncbi:cation:proton antiporter, partial [Escherichia coli]|nr:cation:proton antiporter [Escherichia coli]
VFTKKNIHEPWLFSLPSLILMVLVPVIFFVPNIFGKGIIVPALRAVSGGNHQIDQLAPHVSQWHGFNIPLLLTIIIILLGSVLAIKVDWKKVFTGKIRQISVSKSYE